MSQSAHLEQPSAHPGSPSVTPDEAPDSSASGVPAAGDREVDEILATFAAQTAPAASSDGDDLAERVEAAAQAHRKLQARLSAQRE